MVKDDEKDADSLAASSEATFPRRFSFTEALLYRLQHQKTDDWKTDNSLEVEADAVTGKASLQLLVMHFDGPDFRGEVCRGERDNHASLDYTSLDTSDWHRADAPKIVNILQGKTEGLVGRPDGRFYP
jgi:hypothetical protein